MSGGTNLTLVVEASTYSGSAALLDDDTVVAERSVAMRGREHEALMPAVAELLAEAGLDPEAVGRVVCGAGPGSFTSLRIAGSIAKGFALARGIPLVPVSSLALIVASSSAGEARRPGRYLAALDAMRGEHYVQLYEITESGDVEPATDVALAPASGLTELAARHSATLLGPDRSGAELAIPQARGAALLTKLINATAAADLASWEPGYGRLAEAQVQWEKTHGRPLQPG